VLLLNVYTCVEGVDMRLVLFCYLKSGILPNTSYMYTENKTNTILEEEKEMLTLFHIFKLFWRDICEVVVLLNQLTKCVLKTTTTKNKYIK
jgi:hypothetical protein